MKFTRMFGSYVVRSIKMCKYKHRHGNIAYSTTANPSSANYCLNTVRQFDYENFICTLLLPSNYRTSAFAIRAFNIEVARVQDSVSDSQIGQMRMKFWEDTIEKIYADSNVPQHPVAAELYSASKRHKLTKRFLKRLISVRAAQLSSPTFPDLDAAELYAEASVSSVYYLLLESAGLQSVRADHAASHLGKAQGLANLVRGTPRQAARRAVGLPRDVLARHGVPHEAVFRARSSRALRDAVLEVAHRAKQHLDKARSLGKQVPKEGRCLLLPAVAVGSYLDRLQAADFDVFHPRLRQRDSLLPLRLYWRKLFSEY
ncbi:NADH dehydrogenase (ubiquinone) complex I, assembly factor 6 [Bacillus rossius redtenbacheri]|uniref:NADH dehydrogenase (ubiquinone) complex I, assembly factor 6 n=1 Tax=Bacillus rossius redtenbacheri TaxID=93214 RepID=UPI002FDCC045